MHALGRRALAAHPASRLARLACPRPSPSPSSVLAPHLVPRRAFRASPRGPRQQEESSQDGGVSNGGATAAEDAKPGEEQQHQHQHQQQHPSTHPPETGSKQDEVARSSPPAAAVAAAPTPAANHTSAAATTAEESELHRRHHRRAPPPAAPRPRPLKLKKDSQLPRVIFPQRFLQDHVLLHNDADPLKGFVAFNNINVLDWNMLQDHVRGIMLWDVNRPHSTWDAGFLKTAEAALDAVEWKEHQAANALGGDLDAVARRGDLVVRLLQSLVAVRGIRLRARQGRGGESSPPAGLGGLSRRRTKPNNPRFSDAIDEALAFCNLIQHRWSRDSHQGAIETLMADLLAHDRPPYFLLPWLHFKSYQKLRDAVAGEFAVEATTRAQLSGDAKRPITLFTIPNYNGKIFARAAVSAVATTLGVDLVHLDAQTLSIVVGEYLGQDWSYAQGPISMLGFRTAEINGRIGRDPELDDSLIVAAEEDEDETTTVNVRTNDAEPERTPMEREIQKIRDGARDYVLPSTDRWENLKINTVLEQLVQAANVKANMTGASSSGPGSSSSSSPKTPWREKGLVIHIDDFVELSMTLEGSLLIGRLRNIVDTLWQHGYKIAIVGTSSYESPTEQFSTALTDMAAEECHISCEVRLERGSLWGYHPLQYEGDLELRERRTEEDGPAADPELEKELMEGLKLPLTWSKGDGTPGDNGLTSFKAAVYRMQRAEFCEETVRNVVNVLRAMSTEAATSLRPVFDSFRRLVFDSDDMNLTRARPSPWFSGQDSGRDAAVGVVGAENPAAEAGSEVVSEADQHVVVADGAGSGGMGHATGTDSAVAGAEKDVVDAAKEKLDDETGAAKSSDGEESVASTTSSGLDDVSVLLDCVLPQPAVYNIARQYCRAHQAHRSPAGLSGGSAFEVLRGLMSRHDEWWAAFETRPTPAAEAAKRSRSSGGGSGTAAGGGAHAHAQFNDHEKRLLPGLIKSDTIRTTFDDIHLPKETIATVRLLTSLSLVRPDALSYGILAKERIPGCLLYGPPGTGKTLLAKAVARESGANVLEVTGASIEDMWVGESEKNVRALFSLAKKLSPMVVFIDEADSLLGSRSMRRSRPTRRETLNQFLREWDGMTETNALMMVATNRPDDLDEAILRRLPRKILVDLPLEADRAVILNIFLRDEKVDGSVSVEQLAKSTPFYSGSDLKNLCVAAAMAAVREENEAAERHTGPGKYVYPERRVLQQAHFDQALREVMASVSADAPSLKALRKFDEMYGKPAGPKAKSMGFGVLPTVADTEAALVRKREPVPA